MKNSFSAQTYTEVGSDNFGYADTRLDHGNWSAVASTDVDTLQVVGNVVINLPGSGYDWAIAYWSGGSCNNDQYAQVSLARASLTTLYFGPIVCQSGRSFYILQGRKDYEDLKIVYVNNGTPTDLTAAISYTWAVNDSARLDRVGDSLIAYVNGTRRAAAYSTALTGGNTGIAMNNGKPDTLDNFRCGNIITGCTPLSFNAPSNRVDTIGQDGRFTFAYTGDCVFDSLHIISKGALDSIVLNTAKDSIRYHWKAKFTVAVTCSVSIFSNDLATADDTAIITIRVTGPTMTATPGSYTFIVGFSDTSDQIYADSLTDSITAATSPPGLSIFKTGANIGRWYGIATNTVAKASHRKYAWKNGIKADSLTDSAWCKWDTLHIDSTGLTSAPDSVYWDSLIYIHLSQLNKIKDMDSGCVGDGSAVFADSIGDTLAMRCPHVAVGWYYASIRDTVSADTCTTDSFYVRGAVAPPVTYTLTITNDGHGTTDPTGAQVVDENDSISVTATPDAHYHFGYWSGPEGITIRSLTNATTWILPQTDGTVLATFYIDTVTVSYNANGGSGSPPAGTVSYSYGATVTVLSNTYTRTGYNFTGWNTAANGSGTGYAPTATFSASVNVVLYAQWSLKTYTMTMAHTGNGSTIPATSAVVDTNAAENITASPQPNNHFLRWTRSTTAIVIADSTDATTTATVNGPGTVTAAFGLDTFGLAYTLTGGHATASFLVDSIAPYGGTVRMYLDVDAGWAALGFKAGQTTGRDSIDVVLLEDSSRTITTYLIPVIDSIRDSTAVRDGTYPQAARVDDIVKISGSGFGALGDSSKALQSSTGNTVYRVPAWSNTLIVARPSASSIRGFHQSWIRTKDTVVGSPKSRAILIKIPSTGSAP